MTDEPNWIDKFDVRTKYVLDNRERIGRRWHGLEGQALAHFIVDDPDVRERMGAEFAKEVAQLVSAAQSVLNADTSTLLQLHKELGDERFEKLFAACVAVAETRGNKSKGGAP